jgi:hypothetical protein
MALLASLLMGALGVALVLATSTETVIVGNFRWNRDALRAAGGALDRGIAELATVSDWTAVLNGAVQSRYMDGPASGRRTVSGQVVDLVQLVSMLNCGRLTPCTDGDITAVTADRPWGPNNPRWRVFGLGRFARQAGAASDCYVVVFVADDHSENDGDALRDGEGPLNPGTGRLLVRADAFGPGGAHASVEAVIERHAAERSRVRTLAWRFPS